MVKIKSRGKGSILCWHCRSFVPKTDIRYKNGQEVCSSCFKYLEIEELCLENTQNEAQGLESDPKVSTSEPKESY